MKTIMTVVIQTKKLFRLPLSETEREQAEKGMEIMDITREIPLPSAQKGRDIPAPTANYLSASRFIQKIFAPALKKTGFNRSIKNFSQDYPLKLLGDADRDYISQQAETVLADQKQAQHCQDIFFRIFGEEYDRELEGYAAQRGKKTHELTDKEYQKIASKFTADKGTDCFAALLDAQKAGEIFKVARATPAREDFPPVIRGKNDDYTDYKRKKDHTRAKKATIITVDDVEKIVPLPHQAPPTKSAIITHELLSGLSEIEKQIFALKSAGYSQEEIAKKLGYKGQGTISKKLARINRKIKDQLK